MANTAAPDSTKNLHTWTLLQEAAQCSGVLRRRTQQGLETASYTERQLLRQRICRESSSLSSTKPLLQTFLTDFWKSVKHRYLSPSENHRATEVNVRVLDFTRAGAARQVRGIEHRSARTWNVSDNLKQDKMHLVPRSAASSLIISATVEAVSL